MCKLYIQCGRVKEIFVCKELILIFFIQFSVDESLQIFQYQGPEQIDKGHSVKDIRLTEDHAYILTSRKVK